MGTLQIEETSLAGVKLLTPDVISDDRGSFRETWNRARFRAAGIVVEFVQENLSISARPGTLRGLHYQAPPHGQTKLVRCVRGRIFDVVVDIRRDSPDYGRWIGIELSADDPAQLLIPEGFLHGFVTRAPDCEVSYLCSAHYVAEADGAVHWDSPSLGIDWELDHPPVLSPKDAAAVAMEDFVTPFTGPVAP